MTSEEAIQQLEFDRSMILFDSLTGEEITSEMLKLINKENYLTYVADGIAIEAIKEVQQYREIGTVEEFREAREKQIPKAPIMKPYYEDMTDEEYLCCPTCGDILTDRIPDDNKNFYFHCLNCGQKFDWREEDTK